MCETELADLQSTMKGIKTGHPWPSNTRQRGCDQPIKKKRKPSTMCPYRFSEPKNRKGSIMKGFLPCGGFGRRDCRTSSGDEGEKNEFSSWWRMGQPLMKLEMAGQGRGTWRE
ncbi:uncharacterized protein LOC143213237 isoform X1 [Lasioglossum baleicum]|uniref:uncharacterized protein LOC143213237 isoform X1 n=1 Tax=Lasioglossum baleicum TaxID=434251 RepID=UPI003FCE76CA